MKNLKIFIKTFFLTLFFCVFCQVSIAQESIIDSRCIREQLLRPEGDYSTACCIEGNTEIQLECLNKEFPAADDPLIGEEGKGLNILGSDIILNEQTLPSIIRLLITLSLVLYVMTRLTLSFWIYIRWVFYADSSDETAKLRKEAINSLPGMLFSAGAVIVVQLIFTLLGYKANPFDFSADFGRLLNIECESISSSAECLKYNLSCTPNNFSDAIIENNRDEGQFVSCIENNTEIKPNCEVEIQNIKNNCKV